MATALYFIPGGNGNWASAGNWSLSDGGVSSGTVPAGLGSPNDIYFTANSGSGTVNLPSSGQVYANNLYCTGGSGYFTGKLNFPGTGTLQVSANMTFVSSMTVSYSASFTIIMYGTGGTSNLTTGGISMPVVYVENGTVLLQDNFLSLRNFTSAQGNGIINANGYNITCLGIGIFGTFIAGSGTHTFTSQEDPIEIQQGATFTPGTSTVVLAPSGPNSHTLVINSSSNQAITFYNLTLASPASNIKTNILYPNCSVTVTNNLVLGTTGIGTIGLQMIAQNNLPGATLTVNNWTINSTQTYPAILSGDDPGNSDQWLLVGSGGTYTYSYLSVTDSAASSGTFTANNSTSGGNNTGWTIISPATGGEGQGSLSLTNVGS